MARFLLLFTLYTFLAEASNLRTEIVITHRYDTLHFFDQLIDHNDPSSKNFLQRYWYNTEFYKPGGPIILTSPGEYDAESYIGRLTNSSITGFLAQTLNGITVMLEHRFYGFSYPVRDLKGSTLTKYHTIEQAVGDLEYFVKNVDLRIEGQGSAPWILMGCSYMGALTAWTMHKKPGLFYAGWSSSAPVQPIYNFWRFFEPVREYMPKNCSADVQVVISHVDKVLGSNNETEIRILKDNFGMSDVNTEYFVSTLASPLMEWQNVSPGSGWNTKFGEFCDYLEMDREGTPTPDRGWGLEKTFIAWGRYSKDIYLPGLCSEGINISKCPNISPEADTVDPWDWVVCNEVGWYQVGAPPEETTPRLVSRYYTPALHAKYCKILFPDVLTDGAAGVDRTIRTYGGWDINVDRMVSVVGKRDPWREATLGASSLGRISTDRMPIIFAEGGTHCSDMEMSNRLLDTTIQAATNKALEYMKMWIDERNLRQTMDLETQVVMLPTD